VESLRVKKQPSIWLESFSRVTGLVIVLCAMIMLSACDDGMAACQQTQSYETCMAILN
jgi:hypothetical protein